MKDVNRYNIAQVQSKMTPQDLRDEKTAAIERVLVKTSDADIDMLDGICAPFVKVRGVGQTSARDLACKIGMYLAWMGYDFKK